MKTFSGFKDCVITVTGDLEMKLYGLPYSKSDSLWVLEGVDSWMSGSRRIRGLRPDIRNWIGQVIKQEALNSMTRENKELLSSSFGIQAKRTTKGPIMMPNTISVVPPKYLVLDNRDFYGMECNWQGSILIQCWDNKFKATLNSLGY